MFLSFLWTYNFSCQIKQSQGDMRLEIYYYLEYRRFLPSQFYSRQIKHLSLFFHSTNRLIGTVKFCFQNRKLKDMQVLLITRLLAIDPELLNEAQFVYMHVSAINFFSLLINYHSFLLNIQHPLNNR